MYSREVQHYAIILIELFNFNFFRSSLKERTTDSKNLSSLQFSNSCRCKSVTILQHSRCSIVEFKEVANVIVIK